MSHALQIDTLAFARRLKEAGADERLAEAIVDGLTAADTSQLATKGDVAEVRNDVVQVRGEVAEVRNDVAQIRGEVAEVRNDVAQIRGEVAQVEHRLSSEINEVRSEISEVRTELKLEIGEVRTELKAEISEVRNGVFAIGEAIKTQSAEMNAALTKMDARITGLNSGLWVKQLAGIAVIVTLLTLISWVSGHPLS